MRLIPSRVTLRRMSQGGFLLGAIACLILGSGWLSLLTEIDPLAVLTATLSSHALAWSWGWGLALLTLCFGRFFCGWICPVGTLNHLLGIFARKSPPSGQWRFFKYVLLGMLLIAGSLGLNFAGLFDPLSLFVRTGTSLLAIRETGWAGLWMALPFGLILASNLVRPRFWCRYLCPLGALLGGLSWLGFKQFQSQQCLGCGKCAPKCQQGSAYPHLEGECIECGNCREVCPKKEGVFKASGELLPLNRERRLLLGGMLGMVPLFLLKGTPSPKRSTLLRPPGVNDEEEFLSRCSRCGLCVRICPTKALQPVILEGGLEGILTPKFVPNPGYCRPDCNLCGAKCSTGAIPALSLEEKNQAKIGIAKLDPVACYGCFRCQRVCPQEALADGDVPEVIAARCTGCGKCQTVCPAKGPAIKVVPYGTTR